MSDKEIVHMSTNKGDLTIEIYKKEAPITAGNFLDLVKRGFYNNLTFHRFEPGFVVQGGDPEGNGTGGFVDPETKTERRIKLEINPKLKHDEVGVIAMARSNQPDSASCQFYFCLDALPFLDGQYAVFGKITKGLETLQQLRRGDKMTKVYIETAKS
ncbi:MAG: peptidylprolyl isomerase [Parachlamydiales bacterium]|nr:peptidylprolyl isomerase [Parachlamydiales bacterium]